MKTSHNYKTNKDNEDKNKTENVFCFHFYPFTKSVNNDLDKTPFDINKDLFEGH